MQMLTEEQRLERIVDKLTSFLGANHPSYEVNLGAFQLEPEKIAVINRRLGLFALETARKLKACDSVTALHMFYKALERLNGMRKEYRLPNLETEIYPEILNFAEEHGQKARFQGEMNHQYTLDHERAIEQFGILDLAMIPSKQLVIPRQKKVDPESEEAAFLMTADEIASKTYSSNDPVRYTSDFQAMSKLYALAGLNDIANFCYNFNFDHDIEYKVEIVEGNVVVTRTELHSLVTPFRRKNIDALVDMGFEVSPRRVTYHEFAGSTQVWGDNLNFYIGDNYVSALYIFKQPHSDIRIIDDDIIVMLLEKGLPIPNFDNNDESHSHWYIMCLKGTDAVQVHEQIKRISGEVKDLRERAPYSEEKSAENMKLINQRFTAKIHRVLRSPCEDQLLYDKRRDGDRAELLNAFQELMVAVRDDKKDKYGALIDSVRTAAIGLRYDPDASIRNILTGKFLHSVPN